MIIKVQIEKGGSTASLIESGTEKMHLPLTFLAFSDTMKARILENMVKSTARIGISIFDGPAKTGEWHEEFAPNAIFNR